MDLQFLYKARRTETVKDGKLGEYLQYVRKMVEILYTYEGFSQISVLKTELKNGKDPEWTH